MKKILIFMLTLVMGFMFVNFTIEDKKTPQDEVKSEAATYSVPDDVQKILDNSCVGCHNSDSKNIKGKGKLKFDEFADMKLHKQVGKLADIAEVVKEGDMPPSKFIKNYPDREPTAEEKEKLVKWANEMAKQLTPAE
ncbi:MAG: heme-binding domain-containing protein [Bacteroidetes bacterium]|nr:heme-binding domain-containing protein [Bacteroidota bacterium]